MTNALEIDKSRLPVLQPSVGYLLDVLSNDRLDFDAMVIELEKFPSIVLRLLGLANSAWSSPAQPIVALDVACGRLGMNVVRSVSIALAVSQPFNHAACLTFDPKRFWLDAMLTGEVAFELALLEKVEMPQVARTGGILRGLGVLWLADSEPELMNQILGEARECDGCLSGLTQTRFGLSYLNVGLELARYWELPKCLVDSVFTTPEYSAKQGSLSACIITAVEFVALLKKPENEIQYLPTTANVTEHQMAVFFEQMRTRKYQVEGLVENLY